MDFWREICEKPCAYKHLVNPYPVQPTPCLSDHLPFHCFFPSITKASKAFLTCSICIFKWLFFSAQVFFLPIVSFLLMVQVKGELPDGHSYIWACINSALNTSHFPPEFFPSSVFSNQISCNASCMIPKCVWLQPLWTFSPMIPSHYGSHSNCI